MIIERVFFNSKNPLGLDLSLKYSMNLNRLFNGWKPFELFVKNVTIT